MRYVKPGDRVRVAAKTPYEPLATSIRSRQTEDGFLVENVTHTRRADFGGADIPSTVQIRYEDGSLSGALYVEIFEIITE
jgi:hypothetical protein